MTLTTSPLDINHADLAVLSDVLRPDAEERPAFSRALAGFFGSTTLMIALLVCIGTLS